MIDYIILFFSSFFLVGLLGLQSKNVLHSRYLLAATTSIGISITQYLFVSIVTTSSTVLPLVFSSIGGAIGIMVAIYLHDKNYNDNTTKN